MEAFTSCPVVAWAACSNTTVSGSSCSNSDTHQTQKQKPTLACGVCEVILGYVVSLPNRFHKCQPWAVTKLLSDLAMSSDQEFLDSHSSAL